MSSKEVTAYLDRKMEVVRAKAQTHIDANNAKAEHAQERVEHWTNQVSKYEELAQKHKEACEKKIEALEKEKQELT